MPDPRDLIVTAARAEVARLSRLIALLPALDLEVAGKALDTFESADAAAGWLMAEDIGSLSRGSPIELSRTAEGKKRVLAVLNAIDHGVFL